MARPKKPQQSDGKRYLRNRVDGFIYDYSEQLAKHPKCEEVSEEVAFPERFAKKVADQPIRVGLLSLETTMFDEPPPPTNDAINRDASRRLP